MITLEGQERILMVIRRHWYALARHAAILSAFFVVPAIVFFLYSTTAFSFLTPELKSAASFVFTLYLLGLLLYAFIIWADYYLDIWIITDQRLVDVEQRGLFSRTISELPMTKVQNVTIEIPGFIATMLRFGNIKVETASQSTFIIRDAPDMYQAKDLILKYAHQNSGQPNLVPSHENPPGASSP